MNMLRSTHWTFWCAKCAAWTTFTSTGDYDRLYWARINGYRYDRKRHGWLCAKCAEGLDT